MLEKWASQLIVGVPNLLTAAAIFLVTLYVAGLLSRLVEAVLRKRQAAPGITNLLVEMTYWTLIMLGVITALQRFFNVTAFLTGLGIIGFTVGFALQDVMKNFAAGVILLLQAPFRESDTISVVGFDGIVQAINMRATVMKTHDGRIVIIPNATILSNAIVNYTRADRRRVELPLAVASMADPSQTRKTVLDAVRSVEGIVNEPPPTVFFQALSGPTVNLTARFWVDTARTDLLEAQDAALTRIKMGLQAQGIEIQKA
jgi:small-conductance mechanosensitive channel